MLIIWEKESHSQEMISNKRYLLEEGSVLRISPFVWGHARMIPDTFDYTAYAIRDEMDYNVSNFQLQISLDERLMLTIK
jgi:hypothetical protein